ncbi:MAG: hypothetical protein SWK90_05265 [Chloroflexota bacterium]|nr:hypothetical protein [Chloroflexota bacterium]
MDHLVLDTTVERVWLQGEIALCSALLNKPGNYVEYQVPGFGSRLLIRDKRAGGIRAYKMAVSPEGLSRFPESFDFPSRVIVTKQKTTTAIELLEDSQAPPEYALLWIAAGIEPSIPAWDYVWDTITETDDGKISYIGIVNSTGKVGSA